LTFPVYNRGLVYHKVSEKYEWGLTTTTPRQFKAQMMEIHRLGFSFSTIRDMNPAKNQALVTFDDGYASIHDVAAPIMEEMGAVATIFAITDYVGQLNSWDYFPPDKQVRHMDWSQLRSLHDLGWEIGSHGKTHRRLIHMSTRNIQRELRESKSELEDKLGSPVPTFCPPFNAWNSDLLPLIEEAGYTRIAISFPLSGLPKWGGEFVPRLGVYLQDGLPLFRAKLLASPLAPLAVFQQQLINIAGNGGLVENWGNPR